MQKMFQNFVPTMYFNIFENFLKFLRFFSSCVPITIRTIIIVVLHDVGIHEITSSFYDFVAFAKI